MRFFGHSIRYLGIFLILLLCSGGILLSFSKRDLARLSYGKYLVLLTFFEDRFQDFNTRQSLTDKMDKDIVLVAIDDESLSKIGIWPLPRTVHAKMIRQLRHFGAKVVAFDVLFPEKAPVCGADNPDKDFAKALGEFGEDGKHHVVLSYEVDHAEGPPQPIPDELLFQVKNSQSKRGEQMEFSYLNHETFPIQEFLLPEVLLGSIATQEDTDGVFRNYSLVNNLKDNGDPAYFPSLGLVAAEAFSETQSKLMVGSGGQGSLEFKNQKFEVSPWGEVKVRYSGNQQNFERIPLHAVVNAKPDDATLRQKLAGKLVFVGSTATGAHDLRHTPVDAKLPGVYAHMNVAHMLLNNYAYISEDTSILWSLAVMLGALAVLLAAFSFESAGLDLASVIGLHALLYWINATYFFPQGIELRLFYTSLCLGSVYSWCTFLNFSSAAREKKKIKGTFSRYVSPAVVTEMLDHPDKLKVGGERRDISCLFSDVRDFTSISEKLTPNELSGMLNQYMGQMTDIVFETKGTLDKYIGDAIVAIWGAPLDVPDHPVWAVEAACRMWKSLPAINADFMARGLPFFNVGVGINSGECSVGNMGSSTIFSYTALGDNMNLGARLEGLCKYYGANILISEQTYQRLPPERFKIRPIDSVIVKGKTLPVAIYEVIHDAHVLAQDPQALDLYRRAYAHMLERRFSEARGLLQTFLHAHREDKAAKRVLMLCEVWEVSSEIPEDFYVTKMTEK